VEISRTLPERVLNKPWVGWIGGMICLAALIVGTAWQGNSNGFAGDEPAAATGVLPEELNWVPRNALGFVSLRAAQLWSSPEVDAARNKLAKADGGENLKDIETGLQESRYSQEQGKWKQDERREMATEGKR
jgi:hypothetical protein